MPQKDVLYHSPNLPSGIGWLVAFFFHSETHADLTHALPASVFKYYDTREIPILNCADTEGLFVHPELAPLTHTVISVFSSSCVPGRVSRCQVLLLLLHSLPHFSDEITSATLPLDLPRWDNLSSSAFRLQHLHPTCSDRMFSCPGDFPFHYYTLQIWNFFWCVFF